MDVIHPKLAWVKGRCYRILETDNNAVEDLDSTVIEEYQTREVPRVTTPIESYDDEVCYAEFDIQKTENGQYFTSFEIPSAICGVLIGAKGSTKKRIENETKTSIRFPMQGYEGDITIKGNNRDAVIAARRRMDAMACSARQKHEATHFISLPLNDPKIMQAFNEFKEDVLETCAKDRGITSQVFQKAEKLHLTLGTLVLLSAKEREAASHVLSGCVDKIVRPLLKGRPLVVKMNGIEYMNDDPAEVNVLYGKVFPGDGADGILKDFADQLLKEFVDAGFTNKQHESLKLHATLLNSLFNIGQSNSSLPGRKRDTFDARMILKHFSNYAFGSCCISAVHLSQRHSEGKDGYYSPTAHIDLPLDKTVAGRAYDQHFVQGYSNFK